VLKTRLGAAETEDVLKEVGRAVAASTPDGPDASLQSRVQKARKVLEAIGGSVEIEEHDDKIVICGNGCPLAAAVSVHPEVCRLAEKLVAEIVQAPVVEKCDRETRPQCRFEIDAT
jgi:predicted ArsR family transcriptional regulator